MHTRARDIDRTFLYAPLTFFSYVYNVRGGAAAAAGAAYRERQQPPPPRPLLLPLVSVGLAV